MFKAGKKLTIMLALTFVVTSMSMAARLRARDVGTIPGVTVAGLPDIANTGTGIFKLVYNTRNTRVRGVVRGVAPNLSGANAVFRDDANVEAILINNAPLPAGVPAAANIILDRSIYRVSRRGVASGSATGVAQ